MSRAASRRLALAGLVAMLVLIILPPTPPRLLGSAPLAVGALAALRPTHRWGLAVAVLMLPYFSFGLMNVIADPGERVRAGIFTLVTVMTFLAGLDCERRR
jgi:uncharacterized membrane protein